LFVRVRHGNLLGDGPHPIPALFVRYQLPESQDVGTAGTDAYWHDVLFLLLPSSLSSSPFGVIVAAVVLVAPAAVALVAFIVTLAVVATTFLAIDVSLVVDCCVLSPHEEDHRLPSPLGKVPSLPSSP
jgi:hypothetical protein